MLEPLEFAVVEQFQSCQPWCQRKQRCNAAQRRVGDCQRLQSIQIGHVQNLISVFHLVNVKVAQVRVVQQAARTLPPVHINPPQALQAGEINFVLRDRRNTQALQGRQQCQGFEPGEAFTTHDDQLFELRQFREKSIVSVGTRRQIECTHAVAAQILERTFVHSAPYPQPRAIARWINLVGV